MGWVTINKYGNFCKHSAFGDICKKKRETKFTQKLLKGVLMEIYPRKSNQNSFFPVFLQNDTIFKMNIYFAAKVLWERVSDPTPCLEFR